MQRCPENLPGKEDFEDQDYERKDESHGKRGKEAYLRKINLAEYIVLGKSSGRPRLYRSGAQIHYKEHMPSYMENAQPPCLANGTHH